MRNTRLTERGSPSSNRRPGSRSRCRCLPDWAIPDKKPIRPTLQDVTPSEAPADDDVGISAVECNALALVYPRARSDGPRQRVTDLELDRGASLKCQWSGGSE